MQHQSSPEDLGDGRRARGARTRQRVIAEAVQLASVEGLEGLSIANLAARTGTAKSSVHATFGSKEQLQLAVLESTRDILIDKVIRPSRAAPRGYLRLVTLGDAWLAYLEDGTFDGGCILSSASAEMDGRPGMVRDAVASAMRNWLDLLALNIRAAIASGSVDPSTDPAQLAFELNAIGMAANWHHQLFGGGDAFRLARSAWANLLERHHV